MRCLCVFFLTILMSFQVVCADKLLVIAHRGASGDVPEHTMEAYVRAIEQGADYIEPDLVLTKDNIFVARHDIYLSTTTDVASRPEFASLKATKYGRTDWFVEDFTLAQIKQLRAVQPFESRDQSHNGYYTIPTIDEIMIRIILQNQKGRRVGVYPEIKLQESKATAGYDVSFAIKMVTILQKAKVDYYLQSFNPDFFTRLLPKLSENDLHSRHLVQLIYQKEDGSASVRLDDIPAVIKGIGASKKLLFHPDGSATDYVRRVHSANKKIHVWTIRDDQLPARYRTVQDEIKDLQALNIDGIFTDFPASAIAVRSQGD